MNRRLLEAVIFDLDGTLIDSIGIYYRILDTAFDGLGLPRPSREKIAEAARDGEFDWSRVLPETPGTDPTDMVAEVKKVIWSIYPEILKKDLRMIPGATSVLDTLSRWGIKIGIVTSTPAEAMPHKLRPLKEEGLDTLFEVVITADDVKHPKPHAEPLIVCAKRLGADPDRSVYIGDTCADIRAGKAAGMKTVGVLTGFDDRNTLQNEGPDAVLPSIRALPTTLNGWKFPPST